jgi:hypothetical protein
MQFHTCGEHTVGLAGYWSETDIVGFRNYSRESEPIVGTRAYLRANKKAGAR